MKTNILAAATLFAAFGSATAAPQVGASAQGVMLAAVASAKACTTIDRQFVALHAAKQEMASGVLWIKGCAIKNDGEHVAFEVSGMGWDGANKFAVRAMMHGDGAAPELKFTSVGGSAIDNRALAGSVTGALASAFAVTDSHHVSMALLANTPTALGAEMASNGMTVNIEASGPVQVSLVCRDWAEASTEMFEVGRPLKKQIPTLASAMIQDHGQLSIKGATCPVVVIARSATNATLTLDWQRPNAEKDLSMR